MTSGLWLEKLSLIFVGLNLACGFIRGMTGDYVWVIIRDRRCIGQGGEEVD
jgi:hypothetical protein